MSELASPNPMTAKFSDPARTADGSARAFAPFVGLKTLWVNTGTLCNIECAHCYIESSPANNRLDYLSAVELAPFLDEALRMGAVEIGFTGGEPFMNPDMPDMLSAALEKGFSVLVLTNAMRPMMRPWVKERLVSLRENYGVRLKMRVSIDHYTDGVHDAERGKGSFALAMDGLAWLIENGFSAIIAARGGFGEGEAAMRTGFAKLFSERGFSLDAEKMSDLVVFPEMDEAAPVPEITTQCWGALGKSPQDVMCADARMIVKRKGAARPVVLACTLIAYDRRFELGSTLEEAARAVSLNHPHCAKFCVLGGASCSA